MITKEEYELLNKAINMAGEPAYMGYRNLIESLRQVARAAELATASRQSGLFGRVEIPRRAVDALQEALNALPDWVFEGE